MRQTFETALDEFGRTLGMTHALPLDESDCALISVRGIEIKIGYLSGFDAVQFQSLIGGIPDEPTDDFLTMLLAANHLQRLVEGGAIGCDPRTGVVTLNFRRPADPISAKTLGEELERFVELTEAWRDNIAALVAVDREALVVANGAGEAPAADSQSWIRL